MGQASVRYRTTCSCLEVLASVRYRTTWSWLEGQASVRYLFRVRVGLVQITEGAYHDLP